MAKGTKHNNADVADVKTIDNVALYSETQRTGPPGYTDHLERAALNQVTKKTSHSQGKKIALTPSSNNKAIALEVKNKNGNNHQKTQPSGTEKKKMKNLQNI